MQKRKVFSWKKMIWKGIEIFCYGGIGALISWLAELPQTETVVVAIAVLKMIRNYLKHRK
ncbi:MAG TPA: hypothetical protein ENG51_13605 [Deltaproteobacteria bacterium]|nr:hypothetical protein [Deltaproteobacteria bacterium]